MNFNKTISFYLFKLALHISNSSMEKNIIILPGRSHYSYQKPLPVYDATTQV